MMTRTPIYNKASVLVQGSWGWAGPALPPMRSFWDATFPGTLSHEPAIHLIDCLNQRGISFCEQQLTASDAIKGHAESTSALPSA